MSTPPYTPARRFAHDRLDVHIVAREALARGEAIARSLPRGHAPPAQVDPVVVLLGRVHAMLTRLSRPGRCPPDGALPSGGAPVSGSRLTAT